MDLDQLVGGGFGAGDDLGGAKPDVEGAYRRGYHQAIAEVAHALRSGDTLTAESLDAWVEGAGSKWRKDMPLDRMIVPPEL
ncbi:hypothetical protein OPU71_18500 [Niveibacterium sp. 24ML]|uniref:hypothetical protein n=1 Tax=Niveibacterium sp. 24ML TaxID=2985512 RepID=UPI00226D9D28|nr:hypothetical protein [Niveibacterium sp. 24ML]MCX9158117.1 hypothetical protein [Niveibacterium sp. 24ML]